ncbi:MAG: hypothetical protein ACI9XO_001514 [Paraglaciecola sp.]
MCCRNSVADSSTIGVTVEGHHYFEKGVKSCWIGFPELENIYVFPATTKYETFRKGQTLVDKKMEIKLDVGEVSE